MHLITLMNISNLMKIDHFDDRSSLWWKPISLMKNKHLDQMSSFWWKSIVSIKISLIWRKVLTLIKVSWKSIFLVKNSSSWWKIVTLMEALDSGENMPIWLKCKLYRKFFNMMKIQDIDEIHSFFENSSH